MGLRGSTHSIVSCPILRIDFFFDYTLTGFFCCFFLWPVSCYDFFSFWQFGDQLVVNHSWGLIFIEKFPQCICKFKELTKDLGAQPDSTFSNHIFKFLDEAFVTFTPHIFQHMWLQLCIFEILTHQSDLLTHKLPFVLLKRQRWKNNGQLNL